jgi:hypothetical protein
MATNYKILIGWEYYNYSVYYCAINKSRVGRGNKFEQIYSKSRFNRSVILLIYYIFCVSWRSNKSFFLFNCCFKKKNSTVRLERHARLSKIRNFCDANNNSSQRLSYNCLSLIVREYNTYSEVSSKQMRSLSFSINLI